MLSSWLRDEGFEALDSRHVLEAPDLEHAVAHGAAYYGLARRGRGIRIRSGAPRSYYIGIESAMPAVPGMPALLKALCVVPFGMEEGTSASLEGREFGLIVGEPAEFRFLSSTVRKADPVGAMIEDWGDDLDEMSPLEVTLVGWISGCCGAGHTGKPRHRDWHAGIVVRRERDGCIKERI